MESPRQISVTVTFFALPSDGRVKTFIYQDSPEYKMTGAFADLQNHEVLDLLHRLGINNEEERNNLLEAVLESRRAIRRQFQLSPDQISEVKQWFAEPI